MGAKKKIVILGGGPTGLATALELSKSGLYDIEILEKEPVLGGISATFRHGDFLLDIGTHRLYAGMSADILEWVKEILGDELLTRPRNCKIHFMDKFVDYPPNALELLSKLGIRNAFSFLIDYLKTNVEKHDLKTYEGYMLKRFGRKFYEVFYMPYAEKIWGMPLGRLSSEQAARRVNALGMRDIFSKILLKNMVPPVYYYPKLGIGRIWEKIKMSLIKKDVVVRTSSSVQRLIKSGNEIREVEYTFAGATQKTSCDFIISTMPITEFINCIYPVLPHDVINSAVHLRYRSLVVLYLVLPKEHLSDRETHYFPSKEIPFNRVYEPKNYSFHTAPADKTCIGLEITCDKSDYKWRMSDRRLCEFAAPYLEKLGLLKRDSIEEYFSRRVEHAYPIYQVGYKRHLDVALNEAASIENAISSGRQGLFIHQNIHHSVQMGIAAAEHVAGNKKSKEWYEHALKEFDLFKVFD